MQRRPQRYVQRWRAGVAEEALRALRNIPIVNGTPTGYIAEDADFIKQTAFGKVKKSNLKSKS